MEEKGEGGGDLQKELRLKRRREGLEPQSNDSVLGLKKQQQ